MNCYHTRSTTVQIVLQLLHTAYRQHTPSHTALRRGELESIRYRLDGLRMRRDAEEPMSPGILVVYCSFLYFGHC